MARGLNVACTEVTLAASLTCIEEGSQANTRSNNAFITSEASSLKAQAYLYGTSWLSCMLHTLVCRCCPRTQSTHHSVPFSCLGWPEAQGRLSPKALARQHSRLTTACVRRVLRNLAALKHTVPAAQYYNEPRYVSIQSNFAATCLTQAPCFLCAQVYASPMLLAGLLLLVAWLKRASVLYYIESLVNAVQGQAKRRKANRCSPLSLLLPLLCCLLLAW